MDKDDERAILICSRLADGVYTKGRRGRCDLCGDIVWVSQTSRHALKRGAILRCLRCAAETIEADARFEPLTAEQEVELKSKIGT